MKAHELRTGDELRDARGDLIYRVTRAWTHTPQDSTKVEVRVDVRYHDGGDGTREFDPHADVPHVRPTAAERVARYVELRKRIAGHGGKLGDVITHLDGGDSAGGSTLYLRDLEALLEELAARS